MKVLVKNISEIATPLGFEKNAEKAWRILKFIKMLIFSLKMG